MEAATKLGAGVPDGLASALSFENPPGTRWRFAAFEPPMQGVATAIEDPRVPGARVTTGTLTLPLVVVLGQPCTDCDEKGERQCSECNGTGTGYNYMTQLDFVCPPRVECFRCRRLKYTVWSETFGKGTCKHETFALEATLGVSKLTRCAACGLVGFETAWAGHPNLACGVCGYLACRCVSEARP